jgi:pheromone alpha factor receptor
MSATAIPTPDPTSAAWSEFLDSQPFNLTGLDGTPQTLSLADVSAYNYAIAVGGVTNGFMVGFGAMLVIVLILLTDSKKLSRPIIVLNIISLLLFSTRSLLECIGWTQQFNYGVGEIFLGAVAQYGGNPYWVGIVEALIQPFLYATILTSLILQVRVVFGPEPRARKIITTGLCAVAGVLEVLVIVYNIYVLIALAEQNLNAYNPPWLYPATKILFLVFLGLSSVIFLYKLAITIRMRRRLGLTKFGPLQILFIMSAQCLVVPGTSRLTPD